MKLKKYTIAPLPPSWLIEELIYETNEKDIIQPKSLYISN